MNTNNNIRCAFITLVVLFGMALAAGCDSTEENSDLIGRWELVEVDGQDVTGLLRWTFTASTLRSAPSGIDCETVSTYRRSGNRLTLTVTRQEGDDCGADNTGNTDVLFVEVDRDRLEVSFEDEETVAVFERL